MFASFPTASTLRAALLDPAAEVLAQDADLRHTYIYIYTYYNIYIYIHIYILQYIYIYYNMCIYICVYIYMNS